MPCHDYAGGVHVKAHIRTILWGVALQMVQKNNITWWLFGGNVCWSLCYLAFIPGLIKRLGMLGTFDVLVEIQRVKSCAHSAGAWIVRNARQSSQNSLVLFGMETRARVMS